MTTYYVTTGTSLSDSSRCWVGQIWLEGCKPAELNNPGYISQLRQQSVIRGNNIVQGRSAFDDVAQSLSPNGTCDAAASSAAHDAATNIVNELFKIPLLPSRSYLLPAEVATLYGIKQQLHATDRIVFIHGVTNVADAYINAAILRALVANTSIGFPALSDITCIGFPWEGYATAMNAACATMWGVIGQDVQNSKYVLTGGFKGVSMYIVGRLAKQSSPADVFYLHENMIGGNDPVWRIEPAMTQPPGQIDHQIRISSADHDAGVHR